MNSAQQANQPGQPGPVQGSERPPQPSSAYHPEAEVVVEVTDCATEDAHAVFSALRTSFVCDRAPDDVPRAVAGPHPTVWTSTFDVTDLLAEPAPRRLTAPVSISLQGGYWAVARLRDSLRPAFAVQVTGTVAGDQEQEVQLQLENR
ncbi:hypothetical protein [Streptomyces sp. NPDC059080]|uniref:hypothetical protein n=1 Tax=Streptomyces sp. NPDC059080 TaxID=3346718 RepID=UPI0036BBEF2F